MHEFYSMLTYQLVLTLKTARDYYNTDFGRWIHHFGIELVGLAFEFVSWAIEFVGLAIEFVVWQWNLLFGNWIRRVGTRIRHH